MPKYRSEGKPKPSLPESTINYLNNGASEGERNNELHKHSCQLRDFGMSIEEAGPKLIARASSDGLTEDEAVATINSAYSRGPREPVIKGFGPNAKFAISNTPAPANESLGFKIDPLENVSPIPLPDFIGRGELAFLKSVFKSHDLVAIGKGWEKDGRKGIDGGEVKNRDEWIAYFSDHETPAEEYNNGNGVFFRVNPMKKGGKADAHVSDFRHCLLESDKESKEQQYALYIASGLPIAALVDSGGYSIHAIVKIEAKDRKEYDKRVSAVYSLFSKYQYDFQNGNPSRYSRLPGCIRPEGPQKLLALNIGAHTWADWELSQEDDGLPSTLSLDALLREDVKEPKQIIKRVLYRGCKMVLGGPSKSRKTWVMMDLALSVANGMEWIGMQCSEGKVLYINFELIKWDFQQRWKWMLENKKCESRNIETWTLRGYAADIGILIDKILRRLNAHSYDLVIIDPIYKGLGNRDENKAGDMSDLLNHIERLCTESGCSVAIAAHFPKGNTGDRESMDRIAGSGVFGRDPDAIVTMSAGEDRDGDETVRFLLEYNLRSFPEKKSITVAWMAPLMVEDVVDIKVKGSSGAPKKYLVTDITKILTENGLKFTDWAAYANETLDISKTSFKRLLQEAVDKGLVKKSDDKKGVWIPC